MTRRDALVEPSSGGAADRAHAGLLAQITAGVAAGDDLHEVLQRFLGPLMRLAGAQAGSVRVPSADGQQLLLVGSLGLPQVLGCERPAVQRGCGVCGAALHRDELVWAQDLAPCARDHADAKRSFDCRRALAVPLRHRDQMLGLYSLFFAGDVTLGDDLTSLLKAVGELLGLALHNAQLEQHKLRARVLAERQAMAAEVHDAVAQTLAFVKMRMPLLQQAIAEHDEANADRYCADVRQAVSSAHGNLREVLTHLQAPMDPLGLRHALQASMEAFCRLTQIEPAFDDHAPALELSPTQELQVQRVVQEALANVAKHANAARVWLALEQRPGRVCVRIDDDGAGLPEAEAADARSQHGPGHHGLGIMRQRAGHLGGALEIGPRPGGGTRVELCFPHPAPAAAAASAQAEEWAR